MPSSRRAHAWRPCIVNFAQEITCSKTLQLLTVRETAEVLRQSEWSVRQKIGRGEIPALRVGVGPRAPFRILRADLERWLFAPPPRPAAGGATSIAGWSRGGLEDESA
jgi:excisionase family DNA binding protein